jgi:hypothetical protein
MGIGDHFPITDHVHIRESIEVGPPPPRWRHRKATSAGILDSSNFGHKLARTPENLFSSGPASQAVPTPCRCCVEGRIEGAARFGGRRQSRRCPHPGGFAVSDKQRQIENLSDPGKSHLTVLFVACNLAAFLCWRSLLPNLNCGDVSGLRGAWSQGNACPSKTTR